MPPPTRPDSPNRPAWFARLDAAMRSCSGQTVVVAVSGGGDSVGLLRVLVSLAAERSLGLTVASFDHGTRAGESARDAAFVAELAARLGLPFDLGHWQSHRAGHFEADARQARYRWLLEVAARRGAGAVAVGHTSDDQAETILHRIVRGTGLPGLAGMAPVTRLGSDVRLVRPLLGVTRAEIRVYLGAIEQDWRDDPSNADRSRTRSRIRHDLLPRLAADYNPDVTGALVRLGQLAREASRQADRYAARRLKRVLVAQGEGHVTLDRARLREINPAGRIEILRLLWRQQAWPERFMDHRRWLRLGELAGGTAPGGGAVGAGIEAVATSDRLSLRRRAEVGGPADPPAPRPLSIPGTIPWLDGRVITSLDPFESPTPTDERIDRAAIQGPLTVRAARPGDRFAPLGWNGHSQPLADFFRGRRIPRDARPLVPIIADEAGIIWVAGHRIAHRVRRTDATVARVELRYAR